jgi:hypothetical protein
MDRIDSGGDFPTGATTLNTSPRNSDRLATWTSGGNRSSEALFFASYGITNNLAVEWEAAIIRASLNKAPADQPPLPARIEESGVLSRGLAGPDSGNPTGRAALASRAVTAQRSDPDQYITYFLRMSRTTPG